MEAQPGGRPAAEVLTKALQGGVGMVQLRDKSAPEEAVLEAAATFRRLCDEHGALFVMNDRADLALASGADGVHVGQNDAPVAEVRRAVGEHVLIGLSTHSIEQIRAAASSPAASSPDYLGVGPIYETATKPEAVPVGESLLSYAAANAAQPFFAIGGIDAASIADVTRAGAERVAVVRAVRDAADPAGAAAELRAALEHKAVPGAAR